MSLVFKLIIMQLQVTLYFICTNLDAVFNKVVT